MSKIGLGTVQFGLDYGISSSIGKVTKDDAKNIISFAKENKINLFDTAPAYGTSEKVLGESDISNVKIITKTRNFDAARISNEDIESIDIDFYNSLKDLKIERVYGLLFHNADDLLKPGGEELYKAIKKLKKQKKIHKIGISVYEEKQLEKILSLYDIDIVQVPFSIIDRRLMDSGMIDTLYNKKIEVHSRSVFLQGLLLMSAADRPSHFNKWNGLWQVWHEWLGDNHMTALEASLRFVMSFPQISKVIIGVESVIQLKEILNSSKGNLPEIPGEFLTVDPNLLNPTNW